MADDKRDAETKGEEEERWEIDPERSTAEEIVLRPARHPSRGHTRTLGDIAEVLRDGDKAAKKTDESVDEDSDTEA
ncbi:MAG: hypothetical protein HRU14_11250 [Planctomycetes bacterium]|jgi:hypothetical protein|nr:hypothetical protein [Planctomycetota bacterium]